MLSVHPSFDALLDTVPPASVYAFTASATTRFTDVAYRPGDLLVFGPEPGDLPDDVLEHPAVTQRLRIPMLPGRRSLNLSNSAAIAVYEAWRQHDFATGS